MWDYRENTKLQLSQMNRKSFNIKTCSFGTSCFMDKSCKCECCLALSLRGDCCCHNVDLTLKHQYQMLLRYQTCNSDQKYGAKKMGWQLIMPPPGEPIVTSQHCVAPSPDCIVGFPNCFFNTRLRARQQFDSIFQPDSCLCWELKLK